MYTVFHAESESAVRIDKFLHPEQKIKKNHPMRVSTSYRELSIVCLYRMIFCFEPMVTTYSKRALFQKWPRGMTKQ